MMSRIRWRLERAHRDERGIAAVEFSLVVVPVALILFGVLDFGLGIWEYNNLAQATREGARYAIVRGDGSSPPLVEAGPAAEGPVACNALAAADRVAAVVCQYSFTLEPDKLTVWVQWGCNRGSPDTCSNLDNTINELMRVEADYVYTPFVVNAFRTLVGATGPITINMKSVTRMPIACCF